MSTVSSWFCKVQVPTFGKPRHSCRNTFFGGGDQGYIDYPSLAEKLA
jgi:hypothetical protein